MICATTTTQTKACNLSAGTLTYVHIHHIKNRTNIHISKNGQYSINHCNSQAALATVHEDFPRFDQQKLQSHSLKIIHVSYAQDYIHMYIHILKTLDKSDYQIWEPTAQGTVRVSQTSCTQERLLLSPSNVASTSLLHSSHYHDWSYVRGLNSEELLIPHNHLVKLYFKGKPKSYYNLSPSLLPAEPLLCVDMRPLHFAKPRESTCQNNSTWAERFNLQYTSFDAIYCWEHWLLHVAIQT